MSSHPEPTPHEAMLAGLLNEASAALKEAGDELIALLHRFIAHLDAERRMLEAIAGSGDAETARRFLPAVEKVMFELRMILADVMEGEK